jgi:hypothetical protein
MLQFVLDIDTQSKGHMDIKDLLTDERTVEPAADANNIEMEKLHC